MSDRSRDYDEKRDFIRMNLGTNAVIHSNGASYSATCIDLSSTGMQLEAACVLAVGAQIEVEIGSQHDHLPGLKAVAEVVRVAPKEGETQTFGVRIEHML